MSNFLFLLGILSNQVNENPRSEQKIDKGWKRRDRCDIRRSSTWRWILQKFARVYKQLCKRGRSLWFGAWRLPLFLPLFLFLFLFHSLSLSLSASLFLFLCLYFSFYFIFSVLCVCACSRVSRQLDLPWLFVRRPMLGDDALGTLEARTLITA